MVSSLDILYLVIAFAIIFVTGFVCWFIWQIVVITKEIHKTLHLLTDSIDNVQKAVLGVKRKFGSGKLHDHIRNTVEDLKDKMKK